MLVVQINVVHAEPLQARLAASAHVLRRALHRHDASIHPKNPKFGGQLDLVARQTLQRLHKDGIFFSAPRASKFNLWHKKEKTKNEKEEDGLDDLSDQYLVGVGPVDVGRVEEGDAVAEGVLDDGDAVLFRDRIVVDPRQPHATEPQLGDLDDEENKSDKKPLNQSRKLPSIKPH